MRLSSTVNRESPANHTAGRQAVIRLPSILEPAVLTILACFRNQEIQLAVAGIPIKLGVPALLLQGVNTVGDQGKLILAQGPNRLLDLRNAHRASLYRLFGIYSWA